MSQKFTLRGKTYDLNEAGDVVALQAAFAPDNWPGKKSDAVRHFLALHNMLGLQFGRHLAHNFKKVAKAAIEEKEDGGVAKLRINFSVELDFTSPLVAACGAPKLSYSIKQSSTGVPLTVDLTQSELPLGGEDDMSQILNPKSLEEEKAQIEQRDREETEAEEKRKAEEKNATAPEGETKAPKRKGRKGKKD